MHKCCHHGQTKVSLAGHVVHGVVHEHGVEIPAESDRAHVALEVIALRVQPPGPIQRRLLRILLGRRDQGPPAGQIP